MTDTTPPFRTIWYEPELLHRVYPIITIQANVTLYVPQKMVKDVVIVRDALGNNELLRTGSSQVPASQWLAFGHTRLEKIVSAMRDIADGIHEPF